MSTQSPVFKYPAIIVQYDNGIVQYDIAFWLVSLRFVLSDEQLVKKLWSPCILIDLTILVFPRKVLMQTPSLTFHIVMVLSSEELTNPPFSSAYNRKTYRKTYQQSWVPVTGYHPYLKFYFIFMFKIYYFTKKILKKSF